MNNKHLYLVTGSSSGIGLALCRNLVKNSSNFVIGLARTNSLHADNFQFHAIDLSDTKAVLAFGFPISDEYQSVSLINNAGMLGEVNTLDKIDITALETIIQVNYTSAMLLASLFIQKTQHLAIQKTIINVSSGAAAGAYASWANYCASKAALEMLSKCIELEQTQMEFPIRCFSIAPGVVDTKMQEHIRNSSLENFAMKPKFEELYEKNQLYSPVKVAEKLIHVLENPSQYSESIFRIQIEG